MSCTGGPAAANPRGRGVRQGVQQARRHLGGRSFGRTAGGTCRRAEPHRRRRSSDRAEWNIGVAVQQLAEQGVLRPLDDLAKKGNWLANLPPLLVKNMTYDGHVIAVPVDIHGANYHFYSVKVFHDLKMQPPKTWDEFLAMAPKIKAAGYIPLAYGANAQQVDWLFEAIAGRRRRQGPVSQGVRRPRSPRPPASDAMQHVFVRDGTVAAIRGCGQPEPEMERHAGVGGNQQGRADGRRRLGEGRFRRGPTDLRQGLWLPDGARQSGRLCHDGGCLRVPEDQQA